MEKKSKKPKVYYSMEKILGKNAQYNIIFGQRSAGKSYQVKHYCVNKFLNKGRKFILLRRRKEEITKFEVVKYFADVDIASLTNGEYNIFDAYGKKIYMCYYDTETDKITKKKDIGYYLSLSTEQNSAGVSYLDVDDIIFEEFMSRTTYLSKEPTKLENLYCTVDRKEGRVKMWLLGNTISRVCPYPLDWDIASVMRSMKQDTISVTEHDAGEENGESVKIKIAMEYTGDLNDTSFTIGKHKDMMNRGLWQYDIQPKLPKSYKEYKMLYRFMFVYQGFKFICEYLKDNETVESFFFIKPYYGEIKNKTIVFSDEIKTSRYWQRDIYNPIINNDKLRKLLYNFRESNTFFSDDLSGTDFKDAIDFIIRK